MSELKTLMIATPHGRDFTPEYVTSLLAFVHGSQRELDIRFNEGCLISMSRNLLANICDSDYLLFIDTDIQFPVEAVERLISLDKDIIGASYRQKHEPFRTVVMTITKDGFVKALPEIPEEPFKCDAIGAGFLLIKRAVIDKMFDKDFVKENGLPFNMWVLPDGTEAGEDVGFCMRAKKAGFDIWCDPTIKLNHIADGIPILPGGKK